MANGDDTDIAALLRQRQLMDQMQNITGQGTQADIIQPNLRAFDDTSGGTQTSPTGVQQYSRGGRGQSQVLEALMGGGTGATAMNRSPAGQGLNAASTAKSRLGSGIVGLMTGQGLQGFGGGSGVPKAGTTYQDPTNRPTLNVNTPPGQPVPQSGQMLSLDPNGNLVIVPHNPFGTPTSADSNVINNPTPAQGSWQQNVFRQYNPNLGQ